MEPSEPDESGHTASSTSLPRKRRQKDSSAGDSGQREHPTAMEEDGPEGSRTSKEYIIKRFNRAIRKKLKKSVVSTEQSQAHLDITVIHYFALIVTTELELKQGNIFVRLVNQDRSMVAGLIKHDQHYQVLELRAYPSK